MSGNVEVNLARTRSVEAIDPLAVSPKDAATLLGVSRSHLYELLDRREIESKFSGTRRLVDYQSLKDFYDRLRRQK